MAEQAPAKAKAEAKQPDEESSKSPKKIGYLKRFLTAKWIAIIVGVSILVHGIGFTYYQLQGSAVAAESGPEVDLGEFKFEADPSEGGRVTKADFTLAIALLEEVDRVARPQLKTHAFRVRQDVEELLRQAHSGDFENPTLEGLKRRLQEQINGTLGMRAISDVIITNLKLERANREIEAIAETSKEDVPWVEQPEGAPE